MKVVLVSDWYAERMGYSENLLPKALAEQGAEVHLVTSNLQPPFPNYRTTYEPFLGPRVQPVGVTADNGFMVHRLPAGRTNRGVWIRGLWKQLRTLRPDVVQCFTLRSFSAVQAALAKPLLRYELFFEEHIHRSVFVPPASLRDRMKMALYRLFIGRLLGALSVRCYPIAPDVAELAAGVFGYPENKLEVISLGTDTTLFHPPVSEKDLGERQRIRSEWKVAENEIACIYTGRFARDKEPQLLAAAVERLRRRGLGFRGIFIGSGAPEETREIECREGCQVFPFVPYAGLPVYYRAADIGVWPRQESTSQLDAAASGLPVVLSDEVTVVNRVSGNGALYRAGDVDSLVTELQRLSDPLERRRLGAAGVAKMRESYSWSSIARRRLDDYRRSVEGKYS
jgi:glycosyltransferase involved in cell wall biosynthesis